MTRSAKLAVVFCACLLGSCSQLTSLGGRYIDGGLAFVSLEDDVDCVKTFEVLDVVTGETMWEIGRGTEGPCLSSLPLMYGRRVATVAVEPKSLRAGQTYELSGLAEGSNYLSGSIRITKVAGWRVADMPVAALDPEQRLNDIANKSHLNPTDPDFTRLP